MWLTVVFSFLLAIIAILFWQLLSKDQSRYVKGPKGWPFIGLGLEFVGSDPVC